MGKKKKHEPPPHIDCPEAPAFHPTAEEWSDPLRYIAEVVRPVVEHTSGICRVVPPPEWVSGLTEAFAIDRATLKFNARVQRVDQLQRKHTAVASQRFWNEYQAWMAANGIKRKGNKLNPVFGGKEVELDRLHAIVARRGGYDAVTEDRGWREVANVLDLDDKSGNAAFSLRKLYEKLLRPFDAHCQERAEGGYGLLAAAMSAEASDSRAAAAAAAAADVMRDAGTAEDEGAEILLAMLGMAPDSAKKKAKPGKGAPLPGAGPTSPKARPTSCEKCRGEHAADKLVQCDRCAKGWHLFCLAPPLAAPPARDWVCPECRAKEFEAFAFQDADDYSLEEFESIAATFEEQWFGADALPKLTLKDREAEFWRIVEDGEDVVEVLYGADLDSGDVGSGFPRAPPLGNSDGPYATHPWNLSVMPRQAGRHSSLLRVLDGNIAGVTVPWVYVGMCFSSFCWHVEDHMFYSINYNHWGAPKQWYGVPAWAAAKFEAVFQKELADQVAAQPDLLFQLLSMISPRVLRQHGVPVYSATQAAGEFVVTFPNAYHGGFCMGVNLGEAVNFAPADWLRFGAAALGRLRYFRKPCVVSQDEMLLRVAASQGVRVAAAAAAARALPAPGDSSEQHGQANGVADAEASPPGSPSGRPSPLLCYYVRQELQRVVEEEWVLRCKLWSEGLRRSRRTDLAVGFDEADTDDAECAICHLYMHLSCVECDCCKGRRVCLHHAANLCGCHMNQRRLVYRHTMGELDAIVAGVSARVPADTAAELDAVEAAASARTAMAAAAAAVKQEQQAQQDVKQPQGQQGQQGQQVDIKPEPAEDGQPAGQSAGAASPPDDKAAVQGVVSDMVDAAHTATGEQEAQQAQQQAAAQPPSVKSNVPQQDGPVRPFVSLDVCPWDRAELPEWRDALRTTCQQWQADATEALAKGGPKAEQLGDLAEESEQYMWADLPSDVMELVQRVQAAAAYVAKVGSALKGKLSMEEVEALLALDPKPVPDLPSLPKLQEGLEHARDWLSRAQDFVGEERTVEFKALDSFAAEANRIPVALPEATALRERAAAARKLVEALRSALPNARGEGRRRSAEPLDLEDLRELQRQAAALRVDMPERASLALALERVDVWQSRVLALTEMQAPIDELRELVEEAEGLPAAMPEADEIRVTIERAEAWQRQLEGMLRGRTAVKKLREMASLGAGLGVDMPQLEGLQAEIKRREWEDSARRSLGAKQATLAGLAELLGSASALDAEQTQLARALRERVEGAEAWEARASDLLERQQEGTQESHRPTIQTVNELVNEGFALGIKMDRLQELDDQFLHAVAWMEDARAMLAKAAAAGLGQRPADSGTAAAESAGAAHMDVDAASGQPYDAEEEGDEHSLAPSAAASQRATPEPEADAMVAVLLAAAGAEAVGGEAAASQRGASSATPAPQSLLPDLPPLPVIPKARRKGRQPKAKQGKGKEGSRLPELGVIDSLLEQYGSLLVQAEYEAEGLRKLRSVADGWLEEARPVLQQDFVTDNQLGLLEGLIASGERVGLHMEQVEILKANVEALLWARKVRALLARLPPSALALAEEQQREAEERQRQQQEAEAGAAQKVQKDEDAEMVDVPAEQPSQPQQQQEGEPKHEQPAAVNPEAQQTAVAQEGEQQQDADNEEEEDAAVRQLVAGLSGRVEHEEERCGYAAAYETLPLSHRLPLAEFQVLLEEGYILPCDEKLWSQLKSIVDVAKEFHSKSLQLLAVGRDGASYAHAMDAGDLQRLLVRADRLGIRLDRLPVMQDMLAGFRRWEEGVKALTQGAAGSPVKPSFSALAAASTAAKAWPITSPLRMFVDNAVAQTGDWQERCRKLLAKRNTGARLDAVLQAVAQSVDAAVDQFERRLEAERQLSIAGIDPTSAKNIPPTPGRGSSELYCLCQRPFQLDTANTMPMVMCEGCNEWYHVRCVGITQSQMRSLRRFTCPVCSAVKGNTEPLEGLVARLQRTKRPDRDEVASLLPELAGLPVQPEEGEVLARVVSKFDRWRTATVRAIEVHQTSRTLDRGARMLPLSQAMLHCLLKSALSLEIDATAYADQLLRLLRCNKWRERAEAAMAPPAKLGPEGLGKLLVEGKQLGIAVEQDVTGSRILAAIQAGKEWAERAQAVLEELKGSASELDKFAEVVGRAKEMVQEAEGMGVRMEPLQHQIQERSKLFCLCQKPLCDDPPMVGCNFCKGWFHHGCVGLKPRGADGPGDEPPEAFRCPLCCMRMGVKYAHFHHLGPASLDALKEAALKLPPAPPPAPPKPATAARPAAKATPKAPTLPAFPAGWPALPAMAATMAAAGIRPGMIPAITPGMTAEQLTAALTQVFKASMQAQAQAAQAQGKSPAQAVGTPGGVPGVAAMVPGMPAGAVGMVGVPPQLLALLQKQQAAALAQRAAQEQKAKAASDGGQQQQQTQQQQQAQQPRGAENAQDGDKDGKGQQQQQAQQQQEQQGNSGADPSGQPDSAQAAAAASGSTKPTHKRRKSGEQQDGMGGEPKKKRKKKAVAAEEGGDPEEQAAAKLAAKRRKADKQSGGEDAAKEKKEGKEKFQPGDKESKPKAKAAVAAAGSKKDSDGNVTSQAAAAQKQRSGLPSEGEAAATDEQQQAPQEQAAAPAVAKQDIPEDAGAKGAAGQGQKRRRSSRLEDPPPAPASGGADAPTGKSGGAAAAGRETPSGGKPAAKRKRAERQQQQQQPLQEQQPQAAEEGQPGEAEGRKKVGGKKAKPAAKDGDASDQTAAARRRSGRHAQTQDAPAGDGAGGKAKKGR